MEPRIVLITGITGQDGSYLAELLLERGYRVHGFVRRVAVEDPEHRLWRIRHILDEIELHSASLESFASLHRVIRSVHPAECYHLAAQSFVSYSSKDLVREMVEEDLRRCSIFQAQGNSRHTGAMEKNTDLD